MNKNFDKYLDEISKDAPTASKEEIESTYQKIAQQEGLNDEEKPMHRNRIVRYSVLGAACLVLVIGGINLWPTMFGVSEETTITDEENPINESIYIAEDYGQVYAAIDTARNKSFADTNDMQMNVQEEAVAEDSDMAMPESDATEDSIDEAANGRGGGDVEEDYSKTNVQVEGIDEGDIVKTDGEYIYILRENELIISSAQGANSKIISQTTLFAEKNNPGDSNTNEYANEIYVAGDYLAVITTKNSWQDYEDPLMQTDLLAVEDGIWPQNYTDISQAVMFDISDHSKPMQLDSIGQDGNYLNSRLIDDTLYLISNYYIYEQADPDNPKTFVPGVYLDEERILTEPMDICIIPNIESTAYTTITSIDLSEQNVIDTISVLGGGEIVYMSYENLYIALSRYETNESSPYKEDQYTVVKYHDISTTEIARFSLTEGDVELAASGKVDGTLESQFSMDEYDGNLRMVTTINSNSYAIYTDATKGWSNYVWDEESNITTNSLYVLDANMEVIGSVDELAENERVHSARFVGDTAYFVTFRQVDPLFAVDLSNPTVPTVLSTLKIPGFSEYLHNYGEDRLFGLGMDADEETGRTTGMKLIMFNIADPTDVTEKHTLLLDSTFSEALYNHKAILISPVHNLIAFPVEDGYDVYSYDDEIGFKKQGHFDSAEWYHGTRGIYISSTIYICSYEQITIVNMDSLSLIKKIAF